MSKCKNCGKELVCDQSEIVAINGKRRHVKRSAPHGCPPEFDHTQWEISKEETDIWFAGATAQEEE